MKLPRLLRHLLQPRWWGMRAFPPALQQKIAAAVTASETRHRGELRFVTESGLPTASLLRGQTPRARAIDLFSLLRVWDTAENSGVLIYLQLVDRRVEIIADRGINACVGHEFWEAVCRRMEAEFAWGDFETGALDALACITDALVKHFPAGAENPNELPDPPLFL